MAKYSPMTRAFLALLLAALAAIAAPEPAYEPLAFLAGSCWKGAMPDGILLQIIHTQNRIPRQ